MNLNEINFSFGGLHCLRDFGAIYVEKGGHVIAPAIERDEYKIGGMAGSILLGEGVPQAARFDGSLYFLDDPPSQAAAQARLRRMSAWLTSGRQRLIFDYEPERYYIASVSDALKWTYAGYLEGGLDLAFNAQPYAYALRESTASKATSGTGVQLSLTLDTGVPAPLGVSIQNTAAALITGAEVTAGGRQVRFAGLSLTQGDALQITMEPPIGAAFASGGNALPYAERFDLLEAVKGTQTINVTLTYGGGARGARVTARVRGRWL